MAAEIRGLEVEPVEQWMLEHVNGAEPGLEFELIAQGGSNLTYSVRSPNGHRWALRRPPVRARIATAHDMGREWQILEALHANPEAGIPVPEAVAFCEDSALIGAPFYLMGFADGLILRGPQEAEGMTAEQCRTASESLIDVQVAMHRLDPDSVGLGDLGRREAYVERQLNRWLKQYRSSQSRELPAVDTLYAKLSNAIPAQQAVGLVHGDYRFDNTVLDADHRIIAVLDWELCTLGDPIADFVWSIMYWTDPDEEYDFGSPSPTRHEPFPRRAEAVELYTQRSGLDLSHYDYYVAFSWWKMSCLVEGVVARLEAGAGGGMAGRSRADDARARVDFMLERAVEAAERL